MIRYTLSIPIIIIALLIAPAISVNAKSAKQFEKEIKSKSQDLKNLQKNINEKQAEKERCLLEEKCIKKELSVIEQELAKIQKKSETIRKETKEAEKKLSAAEAALKSANFEKLQWHGVMSKETGLWFRTHHGINQTFSDPIEEKLRLSALKQKKNYLTDAEKREVNSRLALEKWQAAKQNLLDLKVKQEQNLQQQEEAKSKKKQLLSTATGRRVVAENEVNKLRESSKALENLIVNLEKEKEMTRQDEMLSKQMASKRKEFPWPLEGKVATHFGKSKHPDLDTYVISNGIKISAAAGTEVKPVAKGEVMFTGEFRSYGQMVIVDHGGALYTIYGLLGDITVEEGQHLKNTDIIGHLGKSKDSILYFEVKYKGKSEDPLLWLK